MKGDANWVVEFLWKLLRTSEDLNELYKSNW